MKRKKEYKEIRKPGEYGIIRKSAFGAGVIALLGFLLTL